MYKYKVKNNEIVMAQEVGSFVTLSKDLLPYDELEWQETEKEIVGIGGKLLFIDSEEYQQALTQQQAEEQTIAEEEALKPTVEDLAEALDILTNIVLGGE